MIRLLLLVPFLLLLSCRSHSFNDPGSTPESLSDKHMILQLIGTTQKGMYEFALCKKRSNRPLNYALDCKNPFFTRGGVRGRFQLVSLDAVQKYATNKKVKGVVVALTGGVVAVAVAVGTLPLAFTEGALAVGLGDAAAEGIGVILGIWGVSAAAVVSAEGAGLYSIYWGLKSYFTTRNAQLKQAFSADPSEAKMVKNVVDTLPTIAGALDLVADAGQVRAVQAL